MLRILALALALLAPVVARAAPPPLTVFAAASLKTALDEAKTAWEARPDAAKLRISYAGSSALARQIDQGAPADVYLSANQSWMDWLQKKGRLKDGSRRDLLRNSLVLVAYGEAPAVTLSPKLDLAGLLGDGRLAVAFTDSVPAGIYAKQALTSLHLWAQAKPRLAPADDVRSALALVASGEAPFGIVYATDAKAEPKVSVAATFPADSHDPIVYPGAIVKEADNPQAKAFLDWLSGPAARKIFARNGFSGVK